MNFSDRQTIFIGIGETCDPLPGQLKPARYLISCSPCPECDSPGRFVLPDGEFLCVSCDECSHKEILALSSSVWQEVAVFYWCRSSKFASDEVEMSIPQKAELEKFLAGYSDQELKPAWGVLVVGGLCEKRNICIRTLCPYFSRTQSN